MMLCPVDRSLVLRQKINMMCHLTVPQVPEEGAQVQVKGTRLQRDSSSSRRPAALKTVWRNEGTLEMKEFFISPGSPATFQLQPEMDAVCVQCGWHSGLDALCI